MMSSSPRSLGLAVLTGVILLALFLHLFWVPLNPSAWGGPRVEGFFEDTTASAVGRYSRDVRLELEAFATVRSPERKLEATGEALLGYYAVLAVLRYGLLWLLLRRTTRRGWLATLGVVLAAIPMIATNSRHTELDAGLLLFALLLYLTAGDRIRVWVCLLAVPALFALWANVHASALVGLIWLGVLFTGRGVEWWQSWRRGDDDPPRFVWLLAALALSAGTVCANPEGYWLYVEAIEATKNLSLASMPGWQPIDFSRPGITPWFYFATLVILLVPQLATARPYSPTVLLVVLSFGLWPLLQSRGSDYWWLLVPWLVFQLLPRPLKPSESLPRKALAIAAGVLLVALATTPIGQWLITGSPRNLERLASIRTPSGIASVLMDPTSDDRGLREVLNANYPKGRYRGAILSGETQGDFLAWLLDRDDSQPVMFYSRAEMIDPNHWAECRQALEGTGSWWEMLGRHQVNLVVLDPRQYPKLTELLLDDPEWLAFYTHKHRGLLIALRRVPKLPVELMP